MAKGVDTSIELQRNVRNNTTDMQESLKELFTWEKEMKAKEMDIMKSRDGQASSIAPAAQPRHAVPGRSPSNAQASEPTQVKSAAAHTYDHFKERWEKFDVDAALAEVDSQPDVIQVSQTQETLKKVPAPIRRPQVPAEESDFWKNKGNEYFKFGDFLKAKDCYSKSLQAFNTVAAHANRALACLKLKEWKLAEADCSAALALDCRYLKAWQRRASARKSLGNTTGHIQDLDSALRLAPDSVAISQELRQALSDFLASQGLRVPSAKRTVPIHVMEAQPEPTAAAARSDIEVALDASQSKEHKSEAVQQHQRSLECSGSPSSTAHTHKENHTSPIATAGSSQEAQPAARAAMSAPTLNPLSAPTTSADFERHWRGFKGCIHEQAKYLSLIQPSALPRIFGSAMTPGLLASIVSTATNSVLDRISVDHNVAILQHSTEVDRFLMNWMLVSKAAKSDIADTLRKCMSADELEPWRSDFRDIQHKLQL